MTGSAPPASSERPVGVRTFLFADIRGYTRFIVEHGDAAGVRLIERFGSVARRAIAGHRGELVGLAGDEAVAAFESAREALRAGLDFQRAAAEASREDPSVPVSVGIGLDTGEAVPSGGNYVGAALNLAARLCKLAGPSEILASEGVTHVAGKLEGVGYAERGLAQLKGFRDPVRVFKVVEQAGQVSPTPSTLRGTPGSASTPGLPLGGFLGALPATELIEREPELNRVLAAADAVGTGAGRLVMITGEPGVGKTRLAQEIMLTLRNRQFLVATGRCYVQHQGVPFYPFLDALAGAYRSAPESIRLQALDRWPYLARLLPDVSAPATTPSASTPEEQQLLYREVTAFVQALSEEVPIALLLDDLHWADGATLQLLEHLVRHTRADRVLLVGTYRDVEVGRHHPLEGALRDLTREDLVDRVTLRRLAPTGTAKLIASTLGEENVSHALDSLVHLQTEGNPFFTQQLVRYLVERGDLYRRDGRWVERPLQRLEVPESVRSVIGQRMDRLKESTQQVLREAAVLGQTFSFPVLLQLSGRPEAEVEACLEEARTTGLVEERRPDEFAFDHALTQQTLYGELPARRRRALHVAAAEALERLPADQRSALSAELAWHFLEAAQEERAIPYALEAGDRARAVFANAQAQAQYSTVLDIARHTQNAQGELDALLHRAKLYIDTWQGAAALADAERLLELAVPSKDRKVELRARLDLAQACYISALDATDRDFASRCREMYESAAKLADELGDERGKAEALLGTRWFSDFFPELRETIRANVQAALEIGRRLHDEDLVTESELWTWASGTPEEGELARTRLVQRLQERNDFHRLNLLYFSMMWHYWYWGRFRRGVEAADDGIALAHRIGVPPVQYPTLRALSLLGLGRPGEAWSSLQQEVVDPAHPFGRAMQAMGLGMYRFELEDFEQALVEFRDLLVRAKPLRRAWMQKRALEYIARSEARLGRLQAGEWDQIQQELVRGGHAVPEMARAEYLLSAGRAAEALRAAEEYREGAVSESDILEAWSAQELAMRCLLELREAARAVELASKLAPELRAAQADSLLWRVLGLGGRAHAMLGDMPAAQVAYAEARVVAGRVGQSIPDDAARETFFSSAAMTAIG